MREDAAMVTIIRAVNGLVPFQHLHSKKPFDDVPLNKQVVQQSVDGK